MLEAFEAVGKVGYDSGSKTSRYEKIVSTLINKVEIDKAITNLQKLGLEGKDLEAALKNMGFETDVITSKLGTLGDTGGKSAGKLASAFSGLLAKMGAFFGTVPGLATIAVGAIALVGAGLELRSSNLLTPLPLLSKMSLINYEPQMNS